MRRKRESVLCFASNDEGLPKVIRNYRARYRAISRVLDENGEILDRVDRDLQKLSQGGRRGREGDFTSENILRALIVQDMEGLPFREAVIRIGSDPFLQGLRENAEKFITDYEVYEKQPPDCDLTEPVIERHEKLFGQRPVVLAADKGFCPEKSKFEELSKLVAYLAIPRRMQDFMDKLLARCQAFRAGIEGTISGRFSSQS